MRVTIECFSRNRAASAANKPFRRHVQFVAQVFRGGFQFGKIIAVGLDQVAHALDRVALEFGALVAVGHLGCDHGLAAARLGVGGIEPLQRMGDAGAEFGEVAQFLLGQVDLAEQRIGKDLVQLGEEAVLVGGGEVAQIEVIGLRQPQQDLRRHRALVALDQVDVGGRNAEALGDLGLRQPQLLPDPPETGPDEEFLAGIACHARFPNESDAPERGEFGSPRPARGERSKPKASGEGASPRVRSLRRRPLTPTLSPHAGRGSYFAIL